MFFCYNVADLFARIYIRRIWVINPKKQPKLPSLKRRRIYILFSLHSPTATVHLASSLRFVRKSETSGKYKDPPLLLLKSSIERTFPFSSPSLPLFSRFSGTLPLLHRNPWLLPPWICHLLLLLPLPLPLLLLLLLLLLRRYSLAILSAVDALSPPTLALEFTPITPS